MKKIATLIILSISSYLFSQQGNVGINTNAPTNVLDVNGDVRVRKLEISTDSDDAGIVADNNGVLKRNIKDRKGILRAYLSQDFNAPQNANTIYKVLNWNVIEDPNGDFNPDTGIFTAPVKGLYRITYTATIKLNGSNPNTNIVVGVADANTSKWITRFSIMNENTTTNNVGNANTFVGLIELSEGQSCYFGASGYTSIIYRPTGNTGTGIGTFFEIQLIKND